MTAKPETELLHELDDYLASCATGDTTDLVDAIRHRVELIVTQGRAGSLVLRYAAGDRLEVLRPLAFFLAVESNHRERACAVGPIVVEMIDMLATEDPWVRLNLCSAIQRLLMFTIAFRVQPSLAKLLVRSLASTEQALRATAAAAICDMYYTSRSREFSPDDLAAVRGSLFGLLGDDNELVRDEARALRDHLARSE